MQSLSDSPVLVGAVTLLVAVVAVFLSYNANSGLPFVPTKQLIFESPNGSALTAGNQVREGGRRVGLVTDLEPVRKENGDTVAKITIKLDGSYEDVPTDSTVAIRPLSLSGLKYVELKRGQSSEEFVEGDTISVDQARVPVQLDDLGNMYNPETRQGVRNVIGGAGNALAARGRSVNEAVGDLPRLLRHLEPVARTLGDPDTNLGRLIDRLGRTVGTVAPVADSYANGFSAGADALEAWSRNEARLQGVAARGTEDARRGNSLAAGPASVPRARARDLDRPSRCRCRHAECPATDNSPRSTRAQRSSRRRRACTPSSSPRWSRSSSS